MSAIATRVHWQTLLAVTLGGAGLALLLFLAQTALEIRRQAARDEARPADVIVVMGAAQYRGMPSPVFRGRLDHALALYRRGLAPYVLTTGGRGRDPLFTESGVGRDYLSRNGVPIEAILVETEGLSTVHSVFAATEIMRSRNLVSCIVVSDPYHIYRAKEVFEFRGIRAYGSPRPVRPADATRQWARYLEQAIGHLLWAVGLTV